jgi:hypothetical protein
MRALDQSPIRLLRTLALALLAGTLLAGLPAGPAAAQDDDGAWYDTNEYRERPPLVVPPSRDLPPPQVSAPPPNPAWPNDADLRKQREYATRAKARRAPSAEEEAAVLTPSQLTPNRVPGRPGATQTQNPNPNAEQAAAPMTPAELQTPTNLWSRMWSAVRPQQDEVGTFTQEPPRSTLTAPPPGYQTPSPAQPYGVSKRIEPAKPEVPDPAREAR